MLDGFCYSEISKNSLGKWNKMGRQENNALIEPRGKAFILFFSELKEAEKDPAQTSILNQAGISCLPFMSGACVSTDNCKEIVFD